MTTRVPPEIRSDTESGTENSGPISDGKRWVTNGKKYRNAFPK